MTNYRVEQHFANSETYLLHGTYKTLKQAQNKKRKLIESGEKPSTISIIEKTTLYVVVE